MLENLQLARIICDEITEQVTSSNDILPQRDLFINSDGRTYQKRFSDERAELWVTYHRMLQDLRNKLCDDSSPKISECVAITHFGIGECQELTSLAFFKLLAKERSDIAICMLKKTGVSERFPKKDNHLFILIGSQFPSVQQSIDVFCQLPDDVIVLDPLLHYVGQGKSYVKDNAEYLVRNGYDYIDNCTPATPDHVTHLDGMKDEVKRCFRKVFLQGYRKLDTNALDMSIQKIACDNPSHIDLLNAGSGLHFFAVRGESYKVDAVSQISTPEQESTAEALKEKFQTGSILNGKSGRFFVLPNVNVDDGTDASLPKNIYTAYREC